MSASSRGRDLEALGEVLLARADVERRPGPCRSTASRSCRRRTPSRASRGSPGTAATRRSRRGSRRGATRRTGARRAARRRARRGRRGTARSPCAGSGARRRAARRAACADACVDGRRLAAAARRASSTSRSCSTFPAAATTMLSRGVRIAVDTRRARAAPTLEITSARADHRPPERVAAEHRLGDQVVHEVLRVVLDHRDLLEHDLALGVDLREDRLEDHVRRSRRAPLEPARRARARRRPSSRATSPRSARRRGRRRSRRSPGAECVREPLKSRCSMKCETPARRRSRRASRRRSRSRAPPSARSGRAR